MSASHLHRPAEAHDAKLASRKSPQCPYLPNLNDIEIRNHSEDESVLPFRLREHYSEAHILSLSRTTTRASSVSEEEADGNILAGIGLIAGGALYAVGKVELAAVKWIWVRYRQIVINLILSREIHHFKRGRERMFDDLIEFYQHGEYNCRLVWWAQDHLLDQLRRGASRQVSRALERAPVATSLQTLNRLLLPVINACPKVRVDDFMNAMAPVAQRLLKHYNDLEQTGQKIESGAVSSRLLGSIWLMWGGDEERWLRLRLQSDTLYPALCLSQDGLAAKPQRCNTASQMLRESKSVFGPEHPISTILTNLLEHNEEQGTDNVIRRRTLDILLKVYAQDLRLSLSDFLDHYTMGLLGVALESRHRWLEAEVFWRLMIRDEARTPRSLRPIGISLYALNLLSHNLRHQLRNDEADLCDKLSYAPCRLCCDRNVGATTRKEPHIPIRRLWRWEHRKNIVVPDDMEKVWVEWSCTNDFFLKSVSSHLDADLKTVLWRFLELDTDG